MSVCSSQSPKFQPTTQNLKIFTLNIKYDKEWIHELFGQNCCRLMFLHSSFRFILKQVPSYHKYLSLFFSPNLIKSCFLSSGFWSEKCYWTLTVPVCDWSAFEPLILGFVSETAIKNLLIFLFGSLMPALTRPAVSFSSQAWSCWPSACGGRWAWRPISPWPLRRAPMHHMSSSGPEPSSLFSDCLAASLRAAAAHGCSNWSVKVPQVPRNTPFRCDPVWLFFCLCFLQYAMFLTLVFLAELVAGVSGFIFRHEASYSSKRWHIFFLNGSQ